MLDSSGNTDVASVYDHGGNGADDLSGKDRNVTNGSGSFDGTIGGTGGVTLSGGRLRLTGVNGFTGDTVIDDGSTLALSGEGSIAGRSEEHTSELQSLMRISYAVFCLKKKTYSEQSDRYRSQYHAILTYQMHTKKY